MKTARLLAAFLVLFLCATSAYAVNRPYQANAEYVGAKSCESCHTERFHSMMSTQHPYKVSPASSETILGDFEKNNTLTFKGVTTTMSKSGSDYFVKTLGPKGNEETYKIKYVIGEFWKQRYITVFPNGGLHILPVQWNFKTKEWVDYHGLKKRDPNTGKGYWSDKGRTYQMKCMGCHTTGSSYTYDKANDKYIDTKWADFGVTCEACHGPGSVHVEAPLDKKKTTIFNPGKYPDDRRANMTCGLCHNRGKSTDGRHGYPTRGMTKNGNLESPIAAMPGDDIDYLYDPKPGVHDDGSPKKHHQQYLDIIQTGHSEAGVSCWDCHASHDKGVSNGSQLKLPGNSLCLSCHKVKDKGVHSIHSTPACIGCHMPKTAKTATPNDIASHQLRVLQPKQTLENEKVPNSCTLCHYHKDHDLNKLQEALDKSRGYSLTK